MDVEEIKPTSPSSTLSDGFDPSRHKTCRFSNVRKEICKKRAERKVFKETRHHIYQRVRQRNSGKWMCEVREPNKKSRIWLGTVATPEMATRAHDVAALALRSDHAALNFLDSATCLARAKSSSHEDIQVAALQAARAFDRHNFKNSSSSSSSLSSASTVDFCHDTHIKGANKPRPISLPIEEQDLDPAWADLPSITSQNKVLQIRVFEGNSSSSNMFVDEEAEFNMPVLLDSMAEGMLLTPPAMQKGFSWVDEVQDDIDLNLWDGC